MIVDGVGACDDLAELEEEAKQTEADPEAAHFSLCSEFGVAADAGGGDGAHLASLPVLASSKREIKEDPLA